MTTIFLLTNAFSFISIFHDRTPDFGFKVLRKFLNCSSFIYVNPFFQEAPQKEVWWRQIRWTPKPKKSACFEIICSPKIYRRGPSLAVATCSINHTSWLSSAAGRNKFKHCHIDPFDYFGLTFPIIKEIGAENSFSHNLALNSAFWGMQSVLM